MPDETPLSDLLGKRVTITSPTEAQTSWTGRMIAYHDDPGVVIEQDGGARICLPQAFGIAEATEAAPEPPLPDGFYGRIELPGYRDDTGWITEESRFGAQAAVVRDWDGREIGIYFIGPACRIVALATPLKRPDPEGPRAITGSAWPADDDSGWDDDEDPGGPF